MAAGSSMEASPFWSRPAAEVLAEIGSAPDGLTEEEARTRRERLGPNALVPRRRATAVVAYLSQFRSPLVLILVFAAAVAIDRLHPSSRLADADAPRDHGPLRRRHGADQEVLLRPRHVVTEIQVALAPVVDL